MIARVGQWLGGERPRWVDALLLALVAAFGWALCTRGLVLSDEGYLLLQSWDLTQGRVIYRDMDSFVAPGIWFLLAATFSIFGPSVFASRMVVWLAFVALVALAYRLVAAHTSRATGLVAAAAMLLFAVWAFPAWTFAFYSPFSVLFALLALERLLAWYAGGADRGLLLCGLCLGLAIVFKQNYGVFALLGAMLGFAAMAVERLRSGDVTAGALVAPVGWTALGVFVAGLPVLIYLLVHGAFGDAWRSLVIHPFEFAGQHDIAAAPLAWVFDGDLLRDGIDRLTYLSFAKLNTPPIAPLQAVRGAERMHVLLYWLPVPIFAGGLLLSLRPRERRVEPVLFTVTAVCGAVYLGLFPRADFNHLVNVYQVVIVAGAFTSFEALRRLRPVSRPGLRALQVLIATLLVAYGGIALYWFVSLRSQLVEPIEGPRGGVSVGRMAADNIGYMVRAVEKHSEPGEPVLTVPDLAMINFLTDRPMPSAYYNLYEHHIAFDGGQSVVDGAEASGVRMALTRYDNFFSDRTGLIEYAPALAHYLQTRFDRVTLGGNDDYMVFLRRDTPRVLRPGTNAFVSCGLEGVSPRQIELRDHLLFSALYHKTREVVPMPEEGLETRCRVAVPEGGGRLVLEMGYRQPFRASPRATLKARIRVDDGATASDVAAQSFRVVARSGNGPQLPYREIAVDLDPWAGQTIDLVFHTRLEGQVRVHPLDFKGFAQVYRDARIESREEPEAR